MYDNLSRFLTSRSGWAVTFIIAALAAYLLWAHTGHVLSALSFLLFLACPLMHLFGHGHGHGRGHSHDRDNPAPGRTIDPVART